MAKTLCRRALLRCAAWGGLGWAVAGCLLSPAGPEPQEATRLPEAEPGAQPATALQTQATPAMLAAQEDAGWVLDYADHFDDPSSGWEPGAADGAAWGYGEGKLWVAFTNLKRWGWFIPGVLWPPRHDYSVFRAEVDLELTKGTLAGLMFCCNGGGTQAPTKYLLLGISDRSIYLNQVEPDQPLRNLSAVDISVRLDSPNHLVVYSQDGVVSAELNGSQIPGLAQAIDPSFRMEGGLVLYMGVNSETPIEGIVSFDDLRVYKPTTAALATLAATATPDGAASQPVAARVQVSPEQTFKEMELCEIREADVVPADSNGDGKPDYWYWNSPVLELVPGVYRVQTVYITQQDIEGEGQTFRGEYRAVFCNTNPTPVTCTHRVDYPKSFAPSVSDIQFTGLQPSRVIESDPIVEFTIALGAPSLEQAQEAKRLMGKVKALVGAPPAKTAGEAGEAVLQFAGEERGLVSDAFYNHLAAGNPFFRHKPMNTERFQAMAPEESCRWLRESFGVGSKSIYFMDPTAPTYVELIKKAAERNGVPVEVVAAIGAAELADYEPKDCAQEMIPNEGSSGPCQVNVDSAIQYKLVDYTEAELLAYVNKRLEQPISRLPTNRPDLIDAALKRLVWAKLVEPECAWEACARLVRKGIEIANQNLDKTWAKSLLAGRIDDPSKLYDYMQVRERKKKITEDERRLQQQEAAVMMLAAFYNSNRGVFERNYPLTGGDPYQPVGENHDFYNGITQGQNAALLFVRLLDRCALFGPKEQPAPDSEADRPKSVERADYYVLLYTGWPSGSEVDDLVARYLKPKADYTGWSMYGPYFGTVEIVKRIDAAWYLDKRGSRLLKENEELMCAIREQVAREKVFFGTDGSDFINAMGDLPAYRWSYFDDPYTKGANGNTVYVDTRDKAVALQWAQSALGETAIRQCGGQKLRVAREYILRGMQW